ncbi:MAG: HtaA domain-containing protein [Pseudolysinimonas sp.]
MILVPGVLATLVAIAPGCDVSGATLDWGFKESFRAYIASDIANGEWTTADGATYETPSFSWTDGTGRWDPATGQGYIDFTGSVRFTGHDGLLDTTIANPTLLLNGDSGTLLLDVTGATMDGDMIDSLDVSFVDLPELAVAGDDAVRTVDAATALSADGEIAFPNYPAGEAFDPVSVTLNVGKTCSTERADDVADDGNPALMGPLAGGIALALVAGAGVFFATRRRRA